MVVALSPTIPRQGSSKIVHASRLRTVVMLPCLQFCSSLWNPCVWQDWDSSWCLSLARGFLARVSGLFAPALLKLSRAFVWPFSPVLLNQSFLSVFLSCKMSSPLLDLRLRHLEGLLGTVACVVGRALQLAYMKHMGDVHPYAPFPIERLEAAVAAAAPEDGSDLLTFGSPTCFRSVEEPQLPSDHVALVFVRAFIHDNMMSAFRVWAYDKRA